MSCVIFDAGALYADSRAYGGRGHTSPGRKSKLHRLDDGRRVGIVAATLGEPERFVAWLNAGADPEDWKGDKPDVRAILVQIDGRVFLYEDSIWPSGPIQSDRYAIGSGQEYALGAMAAGASPLAALGIAATFDANTGGPFDTLL